MSISLYQTLLELALGVGALFISSSKHGANAAVTQKNPSET